MIFLGLWLLFPTHHTLPSSVATAIFLKHFFKQVLSHCETFKACLLPMNRKNIILTLHLKTSTHLIPNIFTWFLSTLPQKPSFQSTYYVLFSYPVLLTLPFTSYTSSFLFCKIKFRPVLILPLLDLCLLTSTLYGIRDL